MRKFYLLFILLSLSVAGFSQQHPQYSQYMFNGQVLNPAYCGSLDLATATLIVREQWLGIEGRPRTQTLAFNSPSRDLNHGFGLSLVNDHTGATGSTWITGQYAYRIRIKENMRLALGLQFSARNFRSGILDLRSQDPNDPYLASNDVNLWRPNFGAGIYFTSKFLYAGISAPDFLNNRLSLDKNSVSREDRVFFGTAGIIIPAGKSVKLKPSIMTKYQSGLPVSVDFNGLIVIKDRYSFGASYRLQDAVIFLAEIRIKSAWRIGYAYDMSISKLKTYTSGSHELMLGFDLNFERDDVSPRYFR